MVNNSTTFSGSHTLPYNDIMNNRRYNNSSSSSHTSHSSSKKPLNCSYIKNNNGKKCNEPHQQEYHKQNHVYHNLQSSKLPHNSNNNNNLTKEPYLIYLIIEGDCKCSTSCVDSNNNNNEKKHTQERKISSHYLIQLLLDDYLSKADDKMQSNFKDRKTTIDIKNTDRDLLDKLKDIWLYNGIKVDENMVSVTDNNTIVNDDYFTITLTWGEDKKNII